MFLLQGEIAFSQLENMDIQYYLWEKFICLYCNINNGSMWQIDFAFIYLQLTIFHSEW